ncbi:MAG: tRNA (guanosine(46)-N7)-methyltransferase TrmB, partial [Actinomycetota bacterium]
TASPLPPGMDQVRRVLEPLGWRHCETYPLTRLSMTGTSWAHLDEPERLAQWFVSEFHPDDFSAGFRHTVERMLATAADPLGDEHHLLLAELDADHSVDDEHAVELLPALVGCFSRHHDLPTHTDYLTLLEESPEMAWIATEGTAFNHATDRVADVEATAEEERISGRPIKEQVEVSGSGRVRQTAHRATMVRRTFPAPTDATDGPVSTTVPGSFFEFIDRAPLPDGSLDLGFDAANAQGIFAMTRRDADATAAESHAATESARPRPRRLPTTEPGTIGSDDPPARLVARPAFTFKVRRRHLSAKRQAEFERWLAQWGVPVDGPPVDWDELFDRSARGQVGRNCLDIGFGHGESTIQMAIDDPDLDVIGVEVHDPGVVTVLDAIVHEPLPNVRVVHGDAIRFLRRVDARSLDVVRIFFPDPWTKVRQHHRRLVRDDIVAALTDRLRPGGELHLATDIADYAEQMQEACDAEPRLAGGVIPRPRERPLTRFEQRGLDAGRTAVDLRYHRT